MAALLQDPPAAGWHLRGLTSASYRRINKESMANSTHGGEERVGYKQLPAISQSVSLSPPLSLPLLPPPQAVPCHQTPTIP